MELVLCKEGEPADSVALVLAQLDFDRDRELVLVDLGPIEELGEELALVLTLREEVLREPGRVGQAGLEVTHNQPRCSITTPEKKAEHTSSGTSLMRVAKVLVATRRTSSSESLILPRTGTTRKMT